jgi:hypothetical protein
MIDPNAPAFPTEGEKFVDLNTGTTQTYGRFPGLTIRAHFAMEAMKGLISNASLSGTWEDYARRSIQAADAVIAELNKETRSKSYEEQEEGPQ